MDRNTFACAGLVSLSVVAAAALISGRVTAGPLDPPAGVISPTYKTLAEVEPRIAISATGTPGDANSVFRISQPGSYYLTGNIGGAPGRSAIEIEASDVTLDLGGFEILGVSGAVDGVTVGAGGFQNITIRNGTIRNFPQDGVDAFNATSVRLIELNASGNGQEGLMTGDGAVVSRCISRQNGVSGIRVTNGSTVTDCTAALNTTRGFITGSGCVVSNCAALSNVGFGFVVANSTLVDSSSHNSGSAGIFSGGHATISRCTVRASGGDGIQVGEACLIEDCVVRGNTGDGIEVFNDCRVADNVIDDNGGGDGASIHALGSRNRIENNRCATADRGLDIDSAGNFVSGNVVLQHTSNYTIVAGNHVEILLSELPQAINFSCSIRLAGSLRGVAGTNGLAISDGNVDIDLGGHTLEGVSGTQVGIIVTGLNQPSVSIRNGTITGWGSHGVELTNAKGVRIRDVTFKQNGNIGAWLGGDATVTDCVARGNLGTGFRGNGATTFQNCSASENTFDGFSLGSTGTAEGCTSTQNGGYGFFTVISCSVQRCVASFNERSGIFVQTGSTVVGNNCHSNGGGSTFGAGIETGSAGGTGSRLEGNSCTFNDVGIQLGGTGVLVIRNSARSNGTNYIVSPGNAVAQILNVSNNTSFVSTDPNANFSY